MELLKLHMPVAEQILGQLLEIGGTGVKEAEAEGQNGVSLEVRSGDGNTMEAVFIAEEEREGAGVEAFAMWPGDIEIAVPEDWKLGDKVSAQGPNSQINLELPQECEPGTTLRYRLKPTAELRVEVPQGAFPGAKLTFERPDGTRIGITVPQGKKPGEFFEVTPPALMVLVPEGVHAGDSVVFFLEASLHLGKAGVGQWFSAEVPKELQLGKYFAARLPPPPTPTTPWGGNSPSKSSLGSLRGSTSARELRFER